ncbi:hypothetical protein [Azorhizophilus paspali]|uniref:Secreted protein n=1 Tax=Azorhizophilus paspali TaxID=69963 RepID=A0ABV6SJP9_AZOPA
MRRLLALFRLLFDQIQARQNGASIFFRWIGGPLSLDQRGTLCRLSVGDSGTSCQSVSSACGAEVPSRCSELPLNMAKQV